MMIRKVHDCIKRHKVFLLTTHINVEGDALGSELGMYRLLRYFHKKVIVVNEDKTPGEYQFLPGVEVIKRPESRLKYAGFDCFLTVDCSDQKRCGEVYKLKSDGVTVLNIDHHISNTQFGDVNWVDPKASSCSEMIYQLYKSLRVPFSRDAALLLYTGMLTDTGSFRYTNTSSSTHKAVGELLAFGIDSQAVYRNVYGNIPFEDVLSASRILSCAKRRANGKIVWLELGQGLERSSKRHFDMGEMILNLARNILGVEVVVLFKHVKSSRRTIRVNFRSQGKVDVNAVAHYFGGGGHKTASGCTIEGPLTVIKKKVLAKLESILR